MPDHDESIKRSEFKDIVHLVNDPNFKIGQDLDPNSTEAIRNKKFPPNKK